METQEIKEKPKREKKRDRLGNPMSDTRQSWRNGVFDLFLEGKISHSELQRVMDVLEN